MFRSLASGTRKALCPEQLESRRMLTTGWGPDAIGATEAWRDGYTGEGVVVAVIDSGIDYHPDLFSGVWVNSDELFNSRDDDGNGYADDFNGWNFVEDNNFPIGTNDHGTHVAGTIVAANNDKGNTGVAHGAKVMPLRVFDDSGVGTTTNISSAVRYAVENGAHIINLSVGSTPTRRLTAALQYAADNNVLVVAAAGNEDANEPVFPASHSANLPNIISVGAYGQSGVRTFNSNRVGNSNAVQVDAPGERILSAVSGNKYAHSSGTSVAAAHVAGAAALVLSAKPELSVAELRDVLVASATKKIEGSDSVGAVNAQRAIDLAKRGIGASAIPAGDADFNRDQRVDFSDFLVLARSFGQSNGGSHRTGDANGDGRIDISDFLVLSRAYVGEQSSRRPRVQKQEVAASDVTEVVPLATEIQPAGSVTPTPVAPPVVPAPPPADTVSAEPEVIDAAVESLTKPAEDIVSISVADIIVSLFSSSQRG